MIKIETDNTAFQHAYELLKTTNQSVFLTGRAGTGKSTFLKYIRSKLAKEMVVVAPTGIAAINVQGQTIHSFFKLPLRTFRANDPEIVEFKKGSKERKVIEEMDVLVIDEISMVRADLMDAIDQSLRKNTGNVNDAFGGKQLLLIGDLFQLEPVADRNQQDEIDLFNEPYKSHFFFDARVMRYHPLEVVELQKVYRQEEQFFIDLLDGVRSGKPTNAQLLEINNRLDQHYELSKNDDTIYLASTNATVNRINAKRLEALKAEEYEYTGVVEGLFSKGKFPAEQKLILREGAQVMFVRNDAENRWVNGTIGKVHKLTKKSIEIEVGDEIYKVKPAEWEDVIFRFNPAEKKIKKDIKGVYTQYPLKLAWAVTIHKSQGLTFDEVVIDLERGAFAGGQTYVALSRCRTLDGITLKSRIRPRDIFVNKRVIEFWEREV